MSKLSSRLNRLEKTTYDLHAVLCPSCYGMGHGQRFIEPFIRFSQHGMVFGEPVLVPDDHIDADGLCVVCGAPSILPPSVEMGLPPDLHASNVFLGSANHWHAIVAVAILIVSLVLNGK